MSADVKLLKVLSTRDNFEKYRAYISSKVLVDEVSEIVDDLTVWYEAHSTETELDVDSFLLWSRTIRHPMWSADRHKIRERICKKVEEEKDIDEDIIKKLLQLETLGSISYLITEIKDKSDDKLFADIEQEIEKYRSKSDSIEDSPIYTIDPTVVHDALLVGAGVDWSMDRLNESVGQLHPTDVVLVTKRPETGGTSFLIHQFTHMLHKLPEGKDAIIFHNEEGKEKVASRIIQCALGITTAEWMANPVKVAKDWEDWKDGRNLVLYAKADMTITDITRELKSGDYFLVGINVIEKVGGFYRVEETERYAKLASFMRQTADKFQCAVFAVTQAPAEAEGKLWLVQSDVYGSKTKMAADSDIMFGIGRETEPPIGSEDIRYIKVIRNKKPITGTMEKKHKYAKIVTSMDTETGRYIQK